MCDLLYETMWRQNEIANKNEIEKKKKNIRQKTDFRRLFSVEYIIQNRNIYLYSTHGYVIGKIHGRETERSFLFERSP